LLGLVAGERVVGPTVRATGADNGEAIGAATDLELKTLFFDREFGQVGAFHEFYDEFDLFEVQNECLG
jgi:hypothetical protein